ncbi:hypothetical protein ABT390_10710 [Streptomyces aurantiacus]|uniref:hypothetical protein n=1 Tax=Streptomyces aurantiacus TaxID=47760 RepID=UPI00131A2628|nr:hypothetical protein [Streptomyces aurantiacus]
MSRLRYVLSVVLLTTCALFAGVCHGPHGLAAANAVIATPPVHHACPGPAHGEHAGTAHPAALAAQPVDRERTEGAGGKSGKGGGERADGPASGAGGADVVGGCAPPRAGPCCTASGQRLLVVIGVDRN